MAYLDQFDFVFWHSNYLLQIPKNTIDCLIEINLFDVNTDQKIEFQALLLLAGSWCGGITTSNDIRWALGGEQRRLDLGLSSCP